MTPKALFGLLALKLPVSFSTHTREEGGHLSLRGMRWHVHQPQTINERVLTEAVELHVRAFVQARAARLLTHGCRRWRRNNCLRFRARPRWYQEKVLWLQFKTYVASDAGLWQPLFRVIAPLMREHSPHLSDDDIWDFMYPIAAAEIKRICDDPTKSHELPPHQWGTGFREPLPHLIPPDTS